MRRGRWTIPLLAAAIALVAVVGIVLSRKPAPVAPPPPPADAAVLILKGLLLDAGVTSRDLRPADGSGETTLRVVVDPAFPLEPFRRKVASALAPLGWTLVTSVATGRGEDEENTLEFRRGKDAPLSLAIARRHRPPPAPVASRRPGKPRLAIVIDDIGLRRDLAEQVVALDAPLTVSVMPRQPHSREAATMAGASGKEVLLHLPMEPLGFPDTDPGPGALMAGMTREEMTRVLADDLGSVPGAVGVNNHMGSRLTADPVAMKTLMRLLAPRRLVFLDSRTSPDTVAQETARKAGVRTVRRDVFLDNVDDPAYVRGQLDEAIRTATLEGEAVAIGHPRENTIAAIREGVERIRQAGVDIVPVSRLAR